MPSSRGNARCRTGDTELDHGAHCEYGTFLTVSLEEGDHTIRPTGSNRSPAVMYELEAE